MKTISFDEEHSVLGIRLERGYVGAFTRNQYPAAIPNGTRVLKTHSEVGDGTADGTVGTVLGSVGHPELAQILYFVEWDNLPRRAVGCIDYKVIVVNEH